METEQKKADPLLASCYPPLPLSPRNPIQAVAASEQCSAASAELQAHSEAGPDITSVSADASARLSATGSTLRQRRARASDASGAQSGSAAAIASSAPAPVSTDTVAAVAPVSRPTALLNPSRVTGFSFGLVGAFLLSILMSFLLVQLYVLDGLDVHKTVANLEMAGTGREWFPVSMSNRIISALTASRVGDQDGADGGGSFGAPSGQRRAPAPPPLTGSKSARPVPLQKVASDTGSAAAERNSILAARPSSTGLHCYTLEAYSETFLQRDRQSAALPLFSCGTRVVDLRSEERRDVLAACQPGRSAQPPHDASTDSNREGDSLFPTLRVVLTTQEKQWHWEVQSLNLVTQRIPLSRVSDDYCDCLDGTDELLTNACSMSGPLTPGAGTRWRQYLVSNQPLRLWEADDVIAQEDAEARGYPLQPRKRGDVGDRLYVSTGPVLPFVCACGTVRQLLAPSFVGDGIVDCCAAEDEAVLQGTPYGRASPRRPSEDPAIVEANDRALEATRAVMLMQWVRRRVSASQYKTTTPSHYEDKLYPYHTSTRAMLVDKGYYSLYTSAEVQLEKQASSAVLERLYARGHRIQRSRVQNGWDRLGRHLVANRTRLQLQLLNVTRELESLEEYVRYRMSEARTSDPLAAGVSMQQMQHHSQLMHMRKVIHSEVEHLSLTTLHRAYGDHYEYYPLLRRILHLESSHLVDWSTPPTLDPATVRRRDERIVTLTERDRMNAAAYAAQQPAPPLHVDNISVSDYGLEVMRHTFVAQRFDSHEAPLIAQRLGLLPDNNISAYTPDVFKNATSPFQRAPVILTGSWQPYHTRRDGRMMVIADPAGDVHLALRACVAPTSTLFRGGGRLQRPTRHPEAPLVVSVSGAEEERKTSKDKLKEALAGETAKVSHVYIPHHTNTPSVLAVDMYAGGIRCEHDPPLTLSRHPRRSTGYRDDASQHRAQVQRTLVTYLCDTQDSILHWAKNGKCLQEVVVGTPSACTSWAWKVAAERVKAIEKAAKP
ncbi:hypothetical protein LSCM4_06753 [Leishmania orientalis]|uniref:Glucosidase II beta subunit-like protein n=1 Tax=Leishmania orientalis TaxID=2249476 RepID=A0A836HH04_9TRYP|nr:hypothetical protein LSCM4_06753 [Leishmania orientalis]